MDSFEFNKIAAAILVVALLVIGLNQIADSIYRVKKPETQGYKIEGVAETKATAKGEAKKRRKISGYKSFVSNCKCCGW
jgi:cytochrome c